MTLIASLKALPIGRIAVVHAAVLGLFLAWRFGGMEPGARWIAAWLCLPAPGLLALALLTRRTEPARAAWVLAPLALLCVQVGASLLNPSRQSYQFWDTEVLRAAPHIGWLPSTPLPTATATDFLLNAGLVLTGLNLMFCHPPRAWLRGLLWLIAGNGMVLAVVGTIFRLQGAELILGRQPSPNPNFFATFVYHNHWGAYAILAAGAALGLLLHTERRTAPRPLTRTHVPLLALVAAVILCTIPLSSARASTVAAAVLAGGAGLLIAGRLARRLRRSGPGDNLRRAGLVATVLIVGLFGLLQGSASWRREFDQTREQITDLRTGGIGDARLVIYRDTWELIRARPVFGWGWQSFQYVYPGVQSEIPRMHARTGRQAVLDAHNDWLQLLAETGLWGCTCLGAALWGCWRWGKGRLRSPPQSVLLLTLGALGLLALVDFPFACPAIMLTAATLLAIGAETARGTSEDLPAESARRSN
ncbi:MAG: O-antigen ligase family protein [Verrucomicrobiota bacterium]